jgi:hypothetical protein
VEVLGCSSAEGMAGTAVRFSLVVRGSENLGVLGF